MRPSPIVAAAASLSIHAAALAALVALEAWIFSQADRAEFGGKRNVVQIELTLASPASPAPEPVATIDPLADREPLNRDAEPPSDSGQHSPTELAREVPLPRSDASVNYAPSLEAELSLPEPDPAAPTTAPARRATSTLQPPSPRLAPVLRRQPMPAPAPSVPRVSAPQIAGTDDQTPPDFLGNPKPDYPIAAYRNGIQGVVLLRLQIDATGRVENVSVERSSGHAVLDRAAVAAVRTWRGRPALRRGQPVATEELLPVQFRIASR